MATGKHSKAISDRSGFEFPYRFIPCMISGLAFYLSQKVNPQLTQTMKLYYEDELARALSEDGSASSTFITPKINYSNI